MMVQEITERKDHGSSASVAVTFITKLPEKQHEMKVIKLKTNKKNGIKWHCLFSCDVKQ